MLKIELNSIECEITNKESIVKLVTDKHEKT